jgi:hypothetical protein
MRPSAFEKPANLAELNGLERPSVSYHHLNSLEYSEIIVSLRVRPCEGGRCLSSENDFGRLSAKRHQNSNFVRKGRSRRRNTQTVDHIETTCYHVIKLISWGLEEARPYRSKYLSKSAGRNEQSVGARLSPTV